MLIANPIYDVVFKRLMEDLKIAKFFIETLIEEEIEDLQLNPKEYTYLRQEVSYAVYRMDFVATIKTITGEHKKVLIEIQKAYNYVDVMRFRNYLGEQYKKEDSISIDGKTLSMPLPIITIYLLGFNLEEIDTPALKIKRDYYDLVNKRVLESKHNFIERLTHDSYIVQIPRIKQKIQTRLDALLSIFEQTNFIDDQKTMKEYDYEVADEKIKSILDLLHHTSLDPEKRRELESEMEAYRIFKAANNEAEIKILAAMKKIEQKDQELSQKDQELAVQARLIEELKAKLNQK